MRVKFKTISAILIFSFIFAMLFIPSIEGAEQYLVTDTKSGETFTISIISNEITVNANDTNSTFYIDDIVMDICCFDRDFTFLCRTETIQNNYVYTIHTYNTETGSLSSFATDCKALKNDVLFTADGTGNVYIQSYNDLSTVHHFENGKRKSDIVCNSILTQMMCVDTDSILLFAVDGVYLLKDSTISKLSSLVPASPCKYTKDDLIIDNMGNKYTYEGSRFDVYQETTKPASVVSNYKGNIEINHSEKCILVTPNTTIANLLTYLELDSSDICIEKTDKSTVTAGKLSTGMSAIADNTTYSIIVLGDLTGEGNINSRDLDFMMKHLTEEQKLSGVFAKAADLDKDNAITTKDLLALSRLY